MSDYNSSPHELGWDDEITNDSGNFILLEEGDYNFTVTAFERGRFPGSAKLPACNKAVLTLSVETPSGTATVKYDLILYSTLEWKLSEFFRSIGQKKHGEPLRPRWNEVVGSRGRAHFKTRTYAKKDGTEGKANDVDKFFDFDEDAASAQPQWRQESMNMPQRSPWDTGTF
ncbi:MAG: hypothetical protein K2N78_12860 [Oscillospiraceae bacterium]|nr:hypothetical protein [Oscillospiraceae bacterium]